MSNSINNNERVWYRHDIPNRYTLAYKVKPLGDRLKVEVGVALCSSKDQYSRRLGRAVSSGRLNYAYAVPGKHELFFSGKMPSTGNEWRNLEEAVISTLGFPSSRNTPKQMELDL